MAARKRHSGGAGDAHRGGEDGDRRVLAIAMRRAGGDVRRAMQILERDIERNDRARRRGSDEGFVARRRRVIEALRQGSVRPCRHWQRCRTMVTAPDVECAACADGGWTRHRAP